MLPILWQQQPSHPQPSEPADQCCIRIAALYPFASMSQTFGSLNLQMSSTLLLSATVRPKCANCQCRKIHERNIGNAHLTFLRKRLLRREGANCLFLSFAYCCRAIYSSLEGAEPHSWPFHHPFLWSSESQSALEKQSAKCRKAHLFLQVCQVFLLPFPWSSSGLTIGQHPADELVFL